MISLKDISKLATMYKRGKNILSYFKEQGVDSCSSEEIFVSYDLQAGSYIKESSSEKMRKAYDLYSKDVAEIINAYSRKQIASLLEVGVGEATTFSPVITHLKRKVSKAYGLDLSWSRIRFGMEYVKRRNPKISSTLFVGDLFHTPFLDNSIEIVYTSHSLEPNRTREREGLEELYRITNKYLILFEPCYELASSADQKRMREHGYVRNLHKTALNLGYHVVEYRLIQHPANPKNPTGVIVIKKNTSKKLPINPFACPIAHTPLIQKRGAYFSKQSLLAYPIIDSVPCLAAKHAVIATHYMECALHV